MSVPFGSRNYGVGAMDKSEWDAMRRRLGADDHGMRVALDPAVKRAAVQSRDKIKADTPVKTGTLQASIEEHLLGPSDHEVSTAVYYAPIIEARPPTKRGAMFSKNIGYAEERLRVNVEERLQELIDGH